MNPFLSLFCDRILMHFMGHNEWLILRRHSILIPIRLIVEIFEISRMQEMEAVNFSLISSRQGQSFQIDIIQ